MSKSLEGIENNHIPVRVRTIIFMLMCFVDPALSGAPGYFFSSSLHSFSLERRY